MAASSSMQLEHAAAYGSMHGAMSVPDPVLRLKNWFHTSWLAGDVLKGLKIPDGTTRVIFKTDNTERWAPSLPVL